jgi:APA family basic amino acid/polyamine antiporter
MYGLPVETWERLGIWMLLGLAIYLAYGRRFSKIGAEFKDRRN